MLRQHTHRRPASVHRHHHHHSSQPTRNTFSSLKLRNFSTSKNHNVNPLQYSRSFLFVPGNSTRMLNKVLTMEIPPDVFVFDLEDSVPNSEKDAAMEKVKQFLSECWAPLQQAEHEVHAQDADKPIVQRLPLLLPRLNKERFGKEAEYLLEGTSSTGKPMADTIFGFNVGKTDNGPEVDQLCHHLNTVEKQNNLVQDRIKLVPTIESARAVVLASEIVGIHEPISRLAGVAFGADDYAYEMDRSRDSLTESGTLQHARSVLATTARAARVAAIDSPYVHLKNQTGLIKESQHVKNLGFSGKLAVHPNQVSIINDVFGVSVEELQLAQRIKDTYEEAQSRGRGSTHLEGRMVDAPVYAQSLGIIRKASLHSTRIVRRFVQQAGVTGLK